MAEYIKREDVHKELRRYGLENGSSLGFHSGAIECADRAIQALPAEDVAPVVHGRWLCELFCHAKCSACESYSMVQGRYCPNCGAKMDLGDMDDA